MFEGFATALIAPFTIDGKIDDSAYAGLIDFQIKSGISALVTCGTTGETPTLNKTEYEHLIQLAVQCVQKRVPVIAGTGSNSTAHAIEQTLLAKKLGADAALIVAPYYNKPTQEGIYLHYKAIHDATNIPILLYNVPGRTVVDIAVDTIARLAKLPRVIGIKECSGDVNRIVRTRNAVGAKFLQWTGDDPMIVPALAQSGAGCISVTSNIAPQLCMDLFSAWKSGDLSRANAINDRLIPLHDAMFCETNPVPVKYAASVLGLCRADVRLPLAPLGASSQTKVDLALAAAGINMQKHNVQKTA